MPSHSRREFWHWCVARIRTGFGRHELIPVRSTEDGIARYVGGYVSKWVNNRREENKGLRFVRYSLHAAYPTGRPLPRKVTAFRDYVVQTLRARPLTMARDEER